MSIPATYGALHSLFLPRSRAGYDDVPPTHQSKQDDGGLSLVEGLDTGAEASVAPSAPTTLAETGLSADQVLGLALKALYAGELSGSELSDKMKIVYAILEPILDGARVEQLVEVRSATGAGTAGYRYALTQRGRERAGQHFDTNGYVGAAPVPLDQYVKYVHELGQHNTVIDRERVASAFSDLIVSDDMLDQLGPAVSARRAMFLYGPPGNGKSAMSAGIGRVLGGAVYMPYVLEIDGQVIMLFDPVNHTRQPVDEGSPLLRSETAVDPRWVRIRRPVITVGGELTMDQLDLNFNPLAKFYEAPVQLKANTGVLLVDDFGRQRVPASDLLNRWIVPLESRIDFLALHTGRKFEVPFDVLVIFATNLEPRSLADEAFLRRIPYKIHATNPSLEQFSAIFYMVCRKYGVDFDQTAVDHLVTKYYQERGLEMRACHPRDVIEHLVNLCRYRRQPATITQRLMDEVCRTYFLDDPVAGTKALV